MTHDGEIKILNESYINEQEWRELGALGKYINLSLTALQDDQGVPSRSNRFQAVEDMIRYLEIHGYTIKKEGVL